MRVFLGNALIAACCGWKCFQTIAELIEEWNLYVSEDAEKQAVVFCRWSRVKEACFIFNQDDWQCLQNSLTNMIYEYFPIKCLFTVDGTKSLHFFLTGTEWYSWKWNRKLLILLVTTSKLSSTLGLLSHVRVWQCELCEGYTHMDHSAPEGCYWNAARAGFYFLPCGGTA